MFTPFIRCFGIINDSSKEFEIICIQLEKKSKHYLEQELELYHRFRYSQFMFKFSNGSFDCSLKAITFSFKFSNWMTTTTVWPHQRKSNLVLWSSLKEQLPLFSPQKDTKCPMKRRFSAFVVESMCVIFTELSNDSVIFIHLKKCFWMQIFQLIWKVKQSSCKKLNFTCKASIEFLLRFSLLPRPQQPTRANDNGPNCPQTSRSFNQISWSKIIEASWK